MNTERLKRLPSYRELQARKAAEEIAQLNRRGLYLPEAVLVFNQRKHEIVDPNPAPEPFTAASTTGWNELHDAFVKLIDSEGCPAAREVLDSLNAGKLRDLKPEQYREAMELIKSRSTEAHAEQPKFRKGDRLVCVDAVGQSGMLTEGNTYTVAEARPGFVYLGCTQGCLTPFAAERFELAPAN